MKPLVAIDARMVGPIPHGIARYVTFLAKGLTGIRSLEYEPVFLVSPGPPHPELALFQTVTLETPFLHPKELIEIPRVLRSLRASVYHSPSFSSLWSCPCASIVTIHDLNHLTYGSWAKKAYYQVLLRHFALNSKAVVTVSEFSRQEISKWLGLPLQKIEIVSNSVEAPPPEPPQSRSSMILEKLGLESGKYFFCLSNSKSHKNLPFLVRAYGNFRQQQKTTWPLVLSVDPSAISLVTNFQGVRCIGVQSEDIVQILSCPRRRSAVPLLV